MIARLWHGTVPVEKKEGYIDYLKATGIHDLQATPGNRGVLVLRREEGEISHFLLLSIWDTLASIQDFAGDPIERARYYPEDKDFLLELETEVMHYQVLFPLDIPPQPSTDKGLSE